MGLTGQQAQTLREYLLRGGFFMADDSRGRRVERVRNAHPARFPERPIVDIPDDDPIFHTVYDITDRYQIPGQAHLRGATSMPTAKEPTGAASTTTRAASWWPSLQLRHRRCLGVGGDPWYPAKFSDWPFASASTMWLRQTH